MSGFFYLLLNGGAYWRVLRYNLFLRSPWASDELTTGDILRVSAGALAPNRAIIEGGYILSVPKISVSVPIAIPEGDSKQEILASLEEGVGLYPGSVDPGALGRVVLLGHSSRASWYRGEYATVFALLHNLNVGDRFTIAGGGKKYQYEVAANITLSPAATNTLLKTAPAESEAVLVTCYPVGSASQRTIIQGRLVATENI
jgi:LPXTG-site transpeptidase (sortase) family protein